MCLLELAIVRAHMCMRLDKSVGRHMKGAAAGGGYGGAAYADTAGRSLVTRVHKHPEGSVRPLGLAQREIVLQLPPTRPHQQCTLTPDGEVQHNRGQRV